MEVVHGSPQAIWVPISYGAATTTIYVGGVVAPHQDSTTAKDGVIMLQQANAALNTQYDMPFGIVIGTNNRKPLFNTTAKTEYITTSSPLASTNEFVGVDGPYIKGGREAMCKVDIIDPCTICKSKLVVDAIGTAPTVVTVSTGDADGIEMTTSATDATALAGYSTVYFRTGANKGTYRINDNASSTDTKWDTPTYAPVSTTAPWDTAVVVNGVLPFGVSKVQLLATYSTAFDVSDACTSYFAVDTIRLDLSEQYKEYMEFRWNIINFWPAAGRN